MGKLTGLVGAMAVFGAAAYLMAPLPPQDLTDPAKAIAAPQPQRTGAKVERMAAAVTANRPAAAPASLIHQIQAELRRVGCYSGNIDGVWSSETKRAMHLLGERAGVLRPVDTPDYIMLALARDQKGHTCVERQRPTAPAVATLPKTPTARAGSTSEAAQPWHVTVQHASPRRSERRVAGSSVAAPIVRPSEPAIPPDRPLLTDGTRMSLGAIDPDALRASRKPHDHSSPADRDETATSRRLATVEGRSPSADHAPVRQAARSAREERALPLSRQSRRAWQRNVFDQMRFNGP